MVAITVRTKTVAPQNKNDEWESAIRPEMRLGTAVNNNNRHKFQVYDNWDLSSPRMSARSELYHLPPIGVGTPFVEALSSYFRRLANAHCLTPGLLFQKKIAPLLDKSYLVRPGGFWSVDGGRPSRGMDIR